MASSFSCTWMTRTLPPQTTESLWLKKCFKLFCSVILFPPSEVMPPRRSPRLAELAASQRAESVPIALDDDDTESLQSAAVCGNEGLRSSLVHIPCCDCLTHPICVDDDIDAICLYCSMELRSTFEHIGNSSCPECGDPVDPSSAGLGHRVCSHVALSLRIMFSVSPELRSPREMQCSALVVKEDVVIMLMWVGSSEYATSTVLNGRDLRNSLACCAWMGETMSQFFVATKRSMLVARSVFQCLWDEMPILRNHCAFQAAPLFHGHSVDVTGQPTNGGANSLVFPSGFPSPPDNVSLLCCCRVGPPTVRTTRNCRRLSGIHSGSVSHVLAPCQQVTSRVAHKCHVECAVIHPMWWIFDRMRGGIGARDVRHALIPVFRKLVGRGSRMVLLPVWVCAGGESFPSQF